MVNDKVARGTILAVDDSPTVRKLVSITLEMHNYRVLSAVDGMSALSELNDKLPDLILLDITMPRMDGYQLCKIIKDNPNTTHIPVVMLSGKDGIFDKIKGRMAGATAYLTKPFDPDKLLKVVEKVSFRTNKKAADWNTEKASCNDAMSKNTKTVQADDSDAKNKVPDKPADAEDAERETSSVEPGQEKTEDVRKNVPIRTICPKCKTVYKNLKPEHIGKFAQCIKCKERFCIKELLKVSP